MKALHGFESKCRAGSGALRVILFQDSTPEAELIRSRLSESGVAYELDHVRSCEAFVAALGEGEVDLILADYAPPGLDGLSALRLARRNRPGVPFIFLSGALGEEVAIEAMKSGATDYVLKNRSERLRTAVRGAMREVEERRQRERAEEELARSTFLPRVGPTLIVEATVTGEPVFIDPAAKERIPGLIELGGRHPVLADLASAARKIRESGGQPDNSEVRVDGALYRRVIFMSPGNDLLRLHVADVTERRRAEDGFKRSEEHFRSLLRYASEMIVILDVDGFILYVSPAIERILGYRPEEMIDTNAFSQVHPDDLRTVRGRFEELLANPNHRLSVEYRMRGKDGLWRHVEAIGTNLLDDTYVDGIVVSARDISERRRAEKALRESEELYRAVVEQTSENIFIVDLESRRIVEANAAFQRSLGYTVEELKGMVLYDVVAHDRERIDELIEVILRKGRYFVGERKYRRKDGSLLDVEVNVGVVPHGDRRAMCIVAHDVTERKHSEIALRESLSNLLALREAGQILSSTLESEEIVTRLLQIMRSVAHLTAAVISRIDHEGNPHILRSAGLEDLWPRVRFTPEAEAARRSVLEVGGRQLFRLRRPGSADDFLVGFCLPISTRDRVLGVLEAYGQESLAQDDVMEIITSLTAQAASALENARLYEELGERERALHNLLEKLLGAQEEERRRVAYEVHDGLAQVAVAAHQNLQAFARRHVPEKEQGRRELDLILKQVRATVSDARRVIANLRPTALDDLGLAAAVSLEVESLSREGYHVDYDERLGDERLPGEMEITLFRVTQEALTNLRKHARTKWVSVELGRRDREVYLEVSDGGRGFDPAALDTLGGGPGERVGLAGMRERVGIIGGELVVKSRPGAGTSIVATIPLTRTS